MKTDYELLKSPAFWLHLGCELESVEKQGELETVRVRDLLCGNLFIVILNTDTVNDIYQILKLRRRNM